MSLHYPEDYITKENCIYFLCKDYFVTNYVKIEFVMFVKFNLLSL